MLLQVVRAVASPGVPRFAASGGIRALVSLAKIVDLNIQNLLPPLPQMLPLDSGVGGDAVLLVPEPLEVLENAVILDQVHAPQVGQGSQVGTSPEVGHGRREAPEDLDRLVRGA